MAKRSIWLPAQAEWRGLKSVGKVEATRYVGAKETTEVWYYLSSLPLDVQRFAQVVRHHWDIENRLHWVLDVAFAEDVSRVRSGHAAQNLAIIHRFALNLLRQETTCKRGVKTKRLRAEWDEAYLSSLLRLVST